jgi:tRNA G18 (ribose-2'-O)-methylase SpoU
MNERILIIEDDQAILKLLQRGLAYEGYTVDTAIDGRMGLIAARDHTPDLVVLDWMLPGMDGLEVCHRLRQGGSIPILMLTAKDTVQDRIQGLDAGEEVISEQLRKSLPAEATVHEVAKRTTKKLFENDKISRIFAIAKMPKPIGLDALQSIKKDVVVLEDLSISGNIGNIIRTSLALGIGGILLLNMDPIDLYDRRLIRSSRGYLFSMPMITASTSDFLDYCKKNNETLLVTAMDADKTVDDIAAIPERLLIVFGSEKDGCSPEIEAAAILKARIPISNKVESLNVSASAGITLYSRSKFNQTG